MSEEKTIDDTLAKTGYKEYLVKGTIIRAKKTPGGMFYWVVMPDGHRFTHLAVIFEKMAKLVEEPHGHCAR